MDPIEINAGRYYLRQLRADDLIDDRPALRASGFPDPDAHIAARADDWRTDAACTWAIAEPTTGALLGEAGLTDVRAGTARAICWIVAAQRRTGIASTALPPVLRFGAAALDLRLITWAHPPGDTAAAGLATALGWTRTTESAGQLVWHTVA